jgi:hypothetical protein
LLAAVGVAAEGVAAESVAVEGVAAESVAVEGVAAEVVEAEGVAAEGVAVEGVAAEGVEWSDDEGLHPDPSIAQESAREARRRRGATSGSPLKPSVSFMGLHASGRRRRWPRR